MSDFFYQEMFELGTDDTEYRNLGSEYVSTIDLDGRRILKIEPEALAKLAAEAVRDVSHLFRAGHLKQLAEILAPDKEALKSEVANREGWLDELENGLETGSEGRGAPKKLPQAIWDEHEAFKKRAEEYCA